MVLRMLSCSVVALSLGVGPASAQIKGAPVAAPNQPERVRYDGESIVSVDVSTAGRLQTVLALTEDVWTHRYPTEPRDGAGWLEVRLTKEAIAALEELQIPHRIVIADLQGLVDAERARLEGGNNVAADWYADFKTWDEVNAKMNELAALRPDLVRIETAGQSLEGRDIRAIRITGPGDPSSRPAFYIEGCQHAREWITPMNVMYIAEQLTSGYDTDAEIKKLLDRCEFIIVPVVNADGYVYTWTTQRFWRKNRRDNGGGEFGVDLNRNWGYGWGGEGSSGNPDSETYRGPAPFSEPETQVVRDYIVANPRITMTLDVHSYSQLILSPWGYTEDLPPDAALFDNLNTVLQDGIASVHGLVYPAGPTYTNIYPASGITQDWAYGERGILSWGVELRPANADEGGFAPPPEEILPSAQENFEGVLRLALDRTRPVFVGLAAPLPEIVDPEMPLVFEALVEPGTEQPVPGTELVHWRTGGGNFQSAVMESLGGGLFRATVPGAACNDTIEVYVSAQAEGGEVISYPGAGAEAPLSVGVISKLVAHNDTCETDLGWSVGAQGDDAVRGIWERVNPQATAAQPGDDHTPDGTMCWVTDGRAGNGIGDYDVDNGSTTLTSPIIDASGNGGLEGGVAYISYWRWYSNNQGNAPDSDSMPVMISNDGGQTWTALEEVTENAGAWVYREFTVADYVEPTSQLRLRFVARDLGDGSIVEAAVDDVQLRFFGCPDEGCYADLDGSGTLDLFDFLAFTNLFNAQDAGADCDEDGAFTLFDFLCFTNAFNAGC
jgi:murein tripeptide amidase MpaA